MSGFQKFRGDPENKLFYILNGFTGGLNTEFSDDASSDMDFDSLINFDVDKLGTLNKRNGFGQNKAAVELLKKCFDTYRPNYFPDPDKYHIMYVKLLRNDNNCFRNLLGFDNYKDYQKQYGFQNNTFELLIITDDPYMTGVEARSMAWYVRCKLPELNKENPELDTLEVVSYNRDLACNFNHDRKLMNINTIEYYDDIWFTDNEVGLVRFDRSATINSSLDLALAFHYTGDIGTFIYTDDPDNGPYYSVENEAYKPSGTEFTVSNLGVNLLSDNPLTDIAINRTSIESIQGVFVGTTDGKIITDRVISNSEPFLLYIIYTGASGFTITAKSGDSDIGLEIEEQSSLSSANIKVYKISFKTSPSNELELKIMKNDATLDPMYAYYNIGQLNPDMEVVKHLNIGKFGMTLMGSRAVFYAEDTIYFSDINIFNYIPANNYLKVPIEPTDKITKICYFKGVYIIFTKEKIFKMVGDFGTSSFALEPVSTSIGCHAGNTVVPIEDTLYFISPRGLYSLKSSTFIEGMQNLKEMDLKVKRLTSDFTRYDPNYNSLTYRYNGVSEHAYAIRYKDKYMLFYNNDVNDKNYPSENDLDVLVYQYDTNTYTTYRFAEKPRFLFMIDGNLQAITTGKEAVEGSLNLVHLYELNETIVFNIDTNAVKVPTIDFTLDNGIWFEFTGKFATNNYHSTILELKSKNNNKSINIVVDTNKIGIEIKNKGIVTSKVLTEVKNIDLEHSYDIFYMLSEDGRWNAGIHIDGNVAIYDTFDKNILTDVVYTTNHIGASYSYDSDKNIHWYRNKLEGEISYLSINNLEQTYTKKLSVSEFGISSTDFGKPIYVELETKGINMNYPQHLKKLKHIFVKMIGGYYYNEFFFELYGDNYLVNNPKKYYTELDEDGTIVYEYDEEKALEVDEITSMLGTFRLNETRLGEGNYRTKKLVIPSKAKNFKCKVYGESSDYLSLESFGFVCKLGKVKES